MLTYYYRPVRLAEAMNRLFDDVFERDGWHAVDGYALPLDVEARNDEFVITAAVPGLKPEHLDVQVLGDRVTIRSEVHAPEADEKPDWLLQERRYGKFARSLTLPAELNGAKAEASIEGGVLTLRIPKAETARPKQITVKAR